MLNYAQIMQTFRDNEIFLSFSVFEASEKYFLTSI